MGYTKGEMTDSGLDSSGRAVLRLDPDLLNKLKAAPDMYEALINLVYRIDGGLALGEKLDVSPARIALTKAEGKGE
jgi:hypothetical protein